MLTNPLFLSFFAGLVLALLAAIVVAFGIHKGYRISAEPKASASALAQQAAPETGAGS